ncbi:hypothetical protein BC827DRAFT_1135218 [Russula dissimulans]|nr:hypothetical protein BC827DRAFT_1135218 [Russula dissimulans]
MAIIEVDRDFDDRFDLLLGTHKWSSFLKKPTKEEEDKAFNVFHCKYNTGRWVEKHGEPI